MIMNLNEEETKINDGISKTLEAFLETHDIDKEEKEIRIKSLKEKRIELQKQRVELEKVQQLNESTIEYVCNFVDKLAKAVERCRFGV